MFQNVDRLKGYDFIKCPNTVHSGMMVNILNPSTWEAEACDLYEFRPISETSHLQNQESHRKEDDK